MEEYFNELDERIHLDLRASKGYTNELEKLTCNDSNLVLKIYLIRGTTTKIRLRV